MTIADLGNLGEFISSLAVLISILYLAKQISSNTNAMKAGAGFDAAHSWAEINNVRDISDEQIMFTARAYDPSERWENFSLVEQFRISSETRSIFERLEGQYYLYKYGSLDEGIWSNRAQWAAGLIQLPFFATWWSVEKSMLMYSQEFVDLIEATTPIEVSVAKFLAKGVDA